MVPNFFAICIDKSLLKTIPTTDGLSPYKNSKKFEKEHPEYTVVNFYEFFDQWDKETIITFEADSREQAWEELSIKHPRLLVRHLKDQNN